MKYDVIVTDAEDIFELSDLQDNILRLDDISEEEVKHIVDIFWQARLSNCSIP